LIGVAPKSPEEDAVLVLGLGAVFVPNSPPKGLDVLEEAEAELPPASACPFDLSNGPALKNRFGFAAVVVGLNVVEDTKSPSEDLDLLMDGPKWLPS
jgi:hypothetical protein